MNAYRIGAIALGILLLTQPPLRSDVFNMEPGLVSLDFVVVRNAGNAADTTGYGGVAYNYQIGAYSVTAAQYTAFLNAVAATDTYGLYHTNMWGQAQGCKIQRSGVADAYTYGVAPDYANRPVNFVSWGSAARFMNWLHNEQAVGSGVDGAWITETGAYNLNGATTYDDLMAVTRNAGAKYWIPSETEWYKAAYHKNNGTTADYWTYPTGTTAVPSNELYPLGDNNATYRTGTEPDYVYTVGSPYWRTEVGAHENSPSPYGTFDQGGNTYEWNEGTVWRADPGQWERCLRGGSFVNPATIMLKTYRQAQTPVNVSQYTGFRVATIPEPGAMVLLAPGVIAALIRRRRRKQ